MSAKSLSPSSLVLGNVFIRGRRTSVRLEPVMWEALRDIAATEEITIHTLITRIAEQRLASATTSSIRAYVVEYYRDKLRRSLENRPLVDYPGKGVSNIFVDDYRVLAGSTSTRQ